jgi:hypothetical protein
MNISEVSRHGLRSMDHGPSGSRAQSHVAMACTCSGWGHSTESRRDVVVSHPARLVSAAIEYPVSLGIRVSACLLSDFLLISRFCGMLQSSERAPMWCRLLRFSDAARSGDQRDSLESCIDRAQSGPAIATGTTA